MTKDKDRTKEQLIDELDNPHRRVTELEQTITDHKNIEEGLRQQIEEYQRLSDEISTMIWHVDQEGTILRANRSASFATGLAREDLVGKSVHDIFPPHEALKFIADYKEIVDSGIPMLGVIEQYTLPSGEIRWAQSDKIPTRRTDADILDVVVFATDVTARKEAEDKLHSHQLKVSEAMELVRIVYWEADPATDVFTFNDAFYALYATTAEQEGGYHMSLDEYANRFVHIDDIPLYYKIVERNKTNVFTEDLMGSEHRIVRKDGEVRHIVTGVSSISDAAGNVTRVIGANLDITDHRKMEDRLYEMEEMFRLFLEHNPIYVFFKDENIRPIYLSKNFETMLARPMKEIIGKTMYDLFPHEIAKSMIQDDLRTLHEGKPIEIQEEFDDRYYITTKFPIIRKGKPPLLAGFTIDMTEWKRSQMALEKSVERLRTLMSATINVIGMAVEVRDPYTAGHQKRVSNLARTISTEMGLPPEQIDGIRLAGSIHDLGKIAIPAEILSSPRMLTDIEFSLIKTHTSTGYDILKSIEFPWPMADIVLQHHERLDGSGYPNGLKNGDILLEARIIAVADVVEAIASHRPYRPALGISIALEEIEKGKGLLYDPMVADACLRLFREKGFNIEREN